MRIVVHGLAGPLEVDGQQFQHLMPGLPQLDDAQVAAVLTYVRRAFGNDAEPVTPERVAAVRAESKDRSQPWTPTELRSIR